MSSSPKPSFYLAVLLVILGLLGYAWMQFKAKEPTAAVFGAPASSSAGIDAAPASGSEPEAPDSSTPTTVKEYTYVAASKLPEVKGVSNYNELGADRVVKFAINVWAGWAPIVYANGGSKPGKQWSAPGGKPFKVELVLIDDPVQMANAYATGDVHIGWATVDMLPLLLETLKRDSRVMPRVYQQIDWSNGGDGIVVRDAIKSAKDLRGKTVVLAQNSPSHYFLLNTLINAGVDPSEVDMRFTSTAFEAASAFNADKKIAAAVTWAPDIYTLSEAKGNRMLVNTQTANKLIADVWFARADFAKDNPDIIEGLVRGIFDAMIALEAQNNKQVVAKQMGDFYGIPEGDTLAMLADAYATNYAENKDFFLNQNSPTNFERTFNTARMLYRKAGVADSRVTFDQIVDFSVIQKLGKEAKYASQKSTYAPNFAPLSASAIQGEGGEILTKTVVIQFFPNSSELSKKVTKLVNGQTLEEDYDPQVPAVLEEVGRLSGQFGAARIVIEGHTDASMKGTVPEAAVQELSTSRADAVKQALVKRFPNLNPNQFAVQGMGWTRAADQSDPDNHSKNRRVEIKVYPLEQQ